MTSIIKKVKPAARAENLKILKLVDEECPDEISILFAIYQPSGNPSKMQKIGTPMPAPVHSKSARI